MQELLSSVTRGVPGMQVAVGLQLSTPLQVLPSEHGAPGGAARCCTPVIGLQLSSVQRFESSIETGLPG